MELFLRFIQFNVKLIYIFICIVLTILFYRKKTTIPPIRNKLLTLSVTELAEGIRQRKITSTELVKAYIARIKEVDKYINVVIEDRFEQALKDAHQADELIKRYSRDQKKNLFAQYPILGIPFTVKESCGVRGMSHVVGSLKRVGKTAKFDCEPVENLRSAGGIPLLVSATPEYCLSIETSTFTHGRSLNPYDFQRSCGGSSGGEGALQGCGASTFGIGSDIGGSIRIPSLFNGVFGHKPTGGLISNRGHFPNATDPKFPHYLQMGPMTRFGSDLALLLQIMVGKNAKKLELSTPVNDKYIKIYYSFGFDGLNGFLHQSVTADMKTAILKAVRYFKNKGVFTKQVNIRKFRNSSEIAMSNLVRLKNFPYVMREGRRPPTVQQNVEEIFKSCFGYSNFTKEALIFELMRTTSAFMPAQNMAKYEKEVEYLKHEIITLLDTNGVLFFPTFHVPAIHHNSSVFPLWGIDYCLIFNILGLPTTHVPMGLNRKGIPVGFQVVAAPMRDKLCLHIAEELERAYGGWKPPVSHEF